MLKNLPKFNSSSSSSTLEFICLLSQFMLLFEPLFDGERLGDRRRLVKFEFDRERLGDRRPLVKFELLLGERKIELKFKFGIELLLELGDRRLLVKFELLLE